ncbi:hypothetical protein ACFSZS_12270 [Seohaeicola zhoushanensis]
MTKVTNFKEQEPALDLAMREFIASTISTASRTMAATFRMAPAYTLSMLIRRCIGYLMVYDAMATADYLEALAQEARELMPMPRSRAPSSASSTQQS